MKPVILFFAQTNSFIPIGIIFALLGSAIIEYNIVSKFYKSLYIRIIKTDESETNQLIIGNVNRNHQKWILHEDGKENKIEIASQIKTENTLNVNKSDVQVSHKKSESLTHNNFSNGIICYDSLGMVHKNQVTNLTQIIGSSLWVEEKYVFDICTFEFINKLSPLELENISEVIEISSPHIWYNQVRDLAKKQLYQIIS